MSDCFDHGDDSYENFTNDEGYTMDVSSNPSHFRSDSLYYFSKLAKTVVITHTTEKAYLFDSHLGKFWVSKKLIKRRNGRLYIWDNTDIKILKETKDVNSKQ